MIKKETIQIENPLLEKVSEIILSNYGLDFSNEKLKDLNSAVIKSAKEASYKNPLEFTQLLLKNKLTLDDLDILLANLTVGETFFFRDEKLFSALQSYKIKEFVNVRNHISIL